MALFEIEREALRSFSDGLKEFRKSPPNGLVPLVFSPSFDIQLEGTAAPGAVLDFAKRKTIFKVLQKRLGLSLPRYFSSLAIGNTVLERIHTSPYLESLTAPETLANIMCLPELGEASPLHLESYVLRSLRKAAGGTLCAMQLALEYGWAVNLCGGFHHAHRDRGGGFCVYADIPLAIDIYHAEHPENKVLVIDLDAHHGDGTASLLGDNARVKILDLYNVDIWPAKEDRVPVDHDYPLRSKCNDTLYLETLREGLSAAFGEFEPDLIIYNAGMDVLESDKLGRLAVTPRGVLARDRMVFGRALAKQIPLVMLISGGYGSRAILEGAHALAELLEPLIAEIASQTD